MLMSGRLRRVRYIAHALMVVGLVWLIVGANATSTAAADVQVTIQNFAFAPATLTIPVGTTVVWTNQDTAPHTATSSAGSAFTFDTGNLTTGKSGKVTFNTAGTFQYFCTVHPRMVATIVVTGSASGGSVLPQTGKTQNSRNWGTIVALVVGAAVVGSGTVLRVRAGKRVQE